MEGVPMTTRQGEEYLEAIYKLGEMEPVSVKALSENLGLSAPSVVEMVKKLIERKLVTRAHDRRVVLTKKGKAEALSIIRKHRLAERFFTDVLQLNWADVHEEACKFEHVLSDQVADALERFLHYPSRCPHGHPIPTREGTVQEYPCVPLSEMKPEQSGVVEKVADEDSPELLRYLATLGLVPDCRVCVEQVAPFKGPFLVKVGDSTYALGREIAEKIWIKECA